MRPEIYKTGNKFFVQKTRKKNTQYAAYTLQYYPVASDADDKTKDGCDAGMKKEKKDKDLDDNEDSVVDDDGSHINMGLS
eukprot:6878972-Ditylum_brightwellii.AAC.1